MKLDRQSSNRAPRKINLLRWFIIGIITGLAIVFYDCIESGYTGIYVLIGYPLIGGFSFIALRKWIYRTFWS